MHDICPGRRLVGARLAMRSQSGCWGWWRCVGSVSQGISDCQCIGSCVRACGPVGTVWRKAVSCKPCMLPATIQGDMISCSMYLEPLVRKPGSWEGGTTVCRSRDERKAPAEDLLQLSVCSSTRHVVMWEPFRPSEPPGEQTVPCHGCSALVGVCEVLGPE